MSLTIKERCCPRSRFAAVCRRRTGIRPRQRSLRTIGPLTIFFQSGACWSREERLISTSVTSSFDLEAIATFAIDAQLKRFVVDGPRASEYQTDYSVEPPALQNTGSIVASVVDRNGRPRIKLPFRPFGQIICTQPERINGIFWCWDALRAGYAFVHLPSLSGPKKVSVIRELAKNCLVRSGYRASSLHRPISGVPSPPAARTKLPSLARKRRPEYQPIPRCILMVTSTFARGGSELQMVATAEALIKRGYDVRILALWSLQPGEPDIGQEIIKIGIQPQLWSDFISSVTRSRWSRCPSTRAPNWSGLPRWFVERAYAVELAIRQIRPSVVHGWLDLPGVIVAATGCTLGAPRVVVGQCTTHEHVKTYGAEVADLVWEAYRAISRNPSVAILNNSAAAARGYERWLRLGAEKIEVLPNCYWRQRVRVPTREETAEFRARLGITREAPAVGTIMRLVPDKDPRLWIDTAQKIAQARPDVRFIIAGSGILQEAITRQIEMLGIADRFTLLGTVSDVGLVYSALDVVLLTSIVEGVPNVLIEAQAAGRPVVTTAVGGTREAVLDGHTGLVVGERSPAQLAQAVLSILDNPAWHDRVRVAGPEFVEGRFAGDRVVSRLLEIYGYAPHAI